MCVSSFCELALVAIGIIVGKTDLQFDWLWGLTVTIVDELCEMWLQLQKDLLWQDSANCCFYPLGMSFVKPIRCCSLVVWRCPLVVLVLGPLRGFSAGQDHLLPVPGTGSPERHYKVICHWQLSMLGLEVPGRVCVMNQSWLPVVPDLQFLSKRYRAHWGHCHYSGICDSLRYFRKMHSMGWDHCLWQIAGERDSSFYMHCLGWGLREY